MFSRILGPQRAHKLARLTGLDVLRVWAHGGRLDHFVTSDHRHGWFDRALYLRCAAVPHWGLYTPSDAAWQHYATCVELFPGWRR